MTALLQENGPVAAWLAGCRHLLATGGDDFNLLISFPCLGAGDEQPLRAFDPRTLLGVQFDSARDVANTIFPSKTLTNSTDRGDFYRRYARANARARKRAWGTYFQRLTDFGDSHVNQLENVIHALATWATRPRAAMVMHTSSSDTDRLKPLGSPCLQYIQICSPGGDQIDLLAVFRNHDFSNKVLGNYFGLGRLLAFIAREAGRDPGLITCLSAHAYFEASMRQQRRLMRL